MPTEDHPLSVQTAGRTHTTVTNAKMLNDAKFVKRRVMNRVTNLVVLIQRKQKKMLSHLMVVKTSYNQLIIVLVLPFRQVWFCFRKAFFHNYLKMPLYNAKSSKSPIFNLKNLTNNEINFWLNIISL